MEIPIIMTIFNILIAVPKLKYSVINVVIYLNKYQMLIYKEADVLFVLFCQTRLKKQKRKNNL